MREIPGKLMIAGEYAVLRPDGVALSMALGTLATVREVAGPPGVDLHAFGQVWSLPGEVLGLAEFARHALDWLAAHDRPLDHRIAVHVMGATGPGSTVRKLGLGTSAAVTVAVLAAGMASTATEIADAARQVHGLAQDPPGSGYDVTSIAHGGVIAYARSPDRAERLRWPTGLFALALYSGDAAATAQALRHVPAAHHLDAIRQAAVALRAAWTAGPSAILTALGACQVAFDDACRDEPSLTSAGLAAARAVATANGCVVRNSGAGGGDCLLAFSDDPARIAACAQAWTERGGLVVAHLPADVAPERA